MDAIRDGRSCTGDCAGRASPGPSHSPDPQDEEVDQNEHDEQNGADGPFLIDQGAHVERGEEEHLKLVFADDVALFVPVSRIDLVQEAERRRLEPEDGEQQGDGGEKGHEVADRLVALDDLDAGDVFTRCLDAFEVPDEDREELTVSYNEIIKSLHEEDVNAE